MIFRIIILFLLLAFSSCKLVPQNDLGRQAGPIYIVKESDNLFLISRKLSVSQEDIVALNDLRPPYRLSKGQQLKVPSKFYASKNVILPPIAPVADDSVLSDT